MPGRHSFVIILYLSGGSMPAERYTTDHPLVQMVMVLKLQELQQNELPSLHYDDLEDYLNDIIWKNRIPLYLSTAAEDILHVNATDIVRYLSAEAGKVTAGKPDDFSDLLGGN